MIDGQPLYGSSGGFIDFPSATFVRDPAGEVDSIGDGATMTKAKPALFGQGTFGFYDYALKRWIPAAPGETSPDGSSYAYVAPPLGGSDAFLIIVNVSSGTTRSTKLPVPPAAAGTFFWVGDYDGRYVYLIASSYGQSYPKGVWRYDPANHAMSQLLSPSAGSVMLVQNGVAWIAFNNPADASPPHPSSGQAFDSVASVNLASGAKTTWIYRPGQSVVMWGLDSSTHPVVMVTSAPNFAPAASVILVDVPGGHGIAIPAGFVPQSVMEADAGRIWFGSSDGIYQWSSGTGFIKAYDFHPDPSFNDPQLIRPAGRCV